MSTFRVEIATIKEILPHNNADRLEIVKVYDWDVVTQKGKYAAGDLVLYIPVDAVLPSDLEQQLFPPDSKITLHRSRIRAIRIRGVVSQGMVVDPASLEKLKPYSIVEGADYAEVLGITKYEPPVYSLPSKMQAKSTKKKTQNPNFRKYTDIENFKWYPDLFREGEMVYISEKLHGTSFRAGWFPMEANTLWRKIKKFFGYLPDWQFCWGSRTVQIQDKGAHKGYYGEDVYTQCVEKYNLKTEIPVGMAIYGEIVGCAGKEPIQKGYHYGCQPGEFRLYVYDVQRNNVWLDYPAFKREVSRMGLCPVPLLYLGPYSRESANELRGGDSLIGNQEVREGIVIKPVIEEDCRAGRKLLKWISDDYLLNKDNTDHH
jgi:RNA ligase (TIGR02306 family)